LGRLRSDGKGGGALLLLHLCVDEQATEIFDIAVAVALAKR